MSCNTKPVYTSSTLDAYVQSSQCEYFLGSTNRMTFGNGSNAVVCLSNPVGSGINLYINKISTANLSSSPFSIDVSSYSGYAGQLCQSNNVIQGNLNCRCNLSPKGQILFGTNVNLTNGTLVHIISIQPYVTYKGAPSGSIILPPGTSRFYNLKTINPNDIATAAMGFTWWEEPTK